MLSNPEIARGIEKWLRDNPHISPERRRAAEHARLSCLVADRNDHQSDICRRLHRMNLTRFVEALSPSIPGEQWHRLSANEDANKFQQERDMTDPINFKPKGDYSEHIIVKEIDGKKVEYVNIDSLNEEQWQQYCRDTGTEPFQRFGVTLKS